MMDNSLTQIGTNKISLIKLTGSTECRFSSENFTMILVTSGFALVNCVSKRALKRGDAFIIKNDFPFTLKAVGTNETKAYVLFIDKSIFNATLTQSDTLKEHFSNNPTFLASLSKQTYRYIDYVLEDTTDTETTLFTAMNAGLNDIIKDYNKLEYATKPDEFANDLLKKSDNFVYINERIYDIYAHYPVSHTSLINSFKGIANKTPIDYIAEKRLIFAEILLTGTTMTVNDIAEVLGYKGASHFVKKFKDVMRITPLQYRK